MYTVSTIHLIQTILYTYLGLYHLLKECKQKQRKIKVFWIRLSYMTSRSYSILQMITANKKQSDQPKLTLKFI